MEKNWYIVYTKPQYEKKVAQILTKKKIENFCPMNRSKAKFSKRNKFLEEPLFKNYVFVNITENDICRLGRIDGVINFLYWKDNRVIIEENEITMIKEFIDVYKNVTIEKTKVSTNMPLKFIDEPTYTFEGNFIALKNKTKKVYLPSLGVLMTTVIDENIFFNKETILLQRNSFLKS